MSPRVGPRGGGDDRPFAILRRVRKGFAWRGQPPVQRTKPVTGVGRHATRDYCPDCGHTKGRCICQ